MNARPGSRKDAVMLEAQAYWLENCVGFRVVDTQEKTLGWVDEVVGTADGRALLLVRGGAFVDRIHAVPIDAIREVVPRRLLVMLAS